MRFFIVSLFSLIICFISGCARFHSFDITHANEPDQIEGIRYYETAPYLLVYSDGKGNFKSEIKWMPDLSRVRVITLYAYASKNNSTLTFNNGLLTSASITVDSTVVPSALIDTIKTLGKTAVASAFNSPHSGTVRTIPAPYLFKIIVDPNSTRLVGQQAIGPDKKPLEIMVSVTKEAVEEKASTPAGS